MKISRNTLNNIMMDNQRRTPLYQTIITDLAITGCIPSNDAEMLLGYKIPSYLHTPDGQCFKEDEEVHVAQTKPSTAVKKTVKKEVTGD